MEEKMSEKVKCVYDCVKCNKTFQDDLYPTNPMNEGVLCGDCLRGLLAKVQQENSEMARMLAEPAEWQIERHKLEEELGKLKLAFDSALSQVRR
jgi:hypothetical protein